MEDEKINKALECLEKAQERLFDKFYASVADGHYEAADKCLDLLERLQLI